MDEMEPKSNGKSNVELDQDHRNIGEMEPMEPKCDEIERLEKRKARSDALMAEIMKVKAEVMKVKAEIMKEKAEGAKLERSSVKLIVKSKKIQKKHDKVMLMLMASQCKKEKK